MTGDSELATRGPRSPIPGRALAPGTITPSRRYPTLMNGAGQVGRSVSRPGQGAAAGDRLEILG